MGFDLPFHDGKDLRLLPLVARRARLQSLVGEDEGHALRFSQAFDVAPAQMLAAACQLGMEGVIAKRADAPYVSARTESWLKLKCGHRQEFVAIGYTERAGAPGEMGGLLLGYHGEDGAMRSAGSVGTGWDAKGGLKMFANLAKTMTAKPAVDPATVVLGRWSKGIAGSEQWVKPQLVVEVAFGEWTPDGNVRHAVFKGMRADKPPASITREKTAGPAPRAPVAPKTNFGVATGVAAGASYGNRTPLYDAGSTNGQIKKSSADRPFSMAAVSHRGLSPRPDHVEPESGSRYFAATLVPDLPPPFPFAGEIKSAGVNPWADINS